jgi:nitroreductase/NAD-dependent dihydropyrimidine dehydrogenase PreA subunit
LKLIAIDEQKCNKDGICADECPMGIIQLQGENGYPEVSPAGEASCINCGHCVAVCPNGALSHRDIAIQDCPPVRKELAIDEQQAVQLLRSRRSIRQYRDKPVEKEKIQRLIEIARYAPTGGNSQLVEWLVVTDRSRIRSLAEKTVAWMRHAIEQDTQDMLPPYFSKMVVAWDAGHDAILRNAPALVVASAPQAAANGMVDLTLALSYLELAAPTLGLGTCWAGLLCRALSFSPSLKEAIGLSVNHPHYYPMMLGYPRVKYQRLPERKTPRIRFL